MPTHVLYNVAAKNNPLYETHTSVQTVVPGVTHLCLTGKNVYKTIIPKEYFKIKYEQKNLKRIFFVIAPFFFSVGVKFSKPFSFMHPTSSCYWFLNVASTEVDILQKKKNGGNEFWRVKFINILVECHNIAPPFFFQLSRPNFSLHESISSVFLSYFKQRTIGYNF